MLFPLVSIYGQTHKTTNQAKDAGQHKTLCYEYKNTTLLEEVDVHYVAILGGYKCNRASRVRKLV